MNLYKNKTKRLISVSLISQLNISLKLTGNYDKKQLQIEILKRKSFLNELLNVAADIKYEAGRDN